MFLNLSWGDSSRYPAEERETREEEEEAQKQREEGAKREETRNTLPRGMTCRKRARAEKSDTEIEAGGEAGTSQSQYKEGHMTNIYLMYSDEEDIVDFVKDHEELYDKTIELSRTKQGRSVSGSGSPTVVRFLSRFVRPSLSCKGHVTAIKVWTCPK